MKFQNYIAILLLLSGFAFGFVARGCADAPKPEKATVQPSQWIGRLSAGDGKGNIFSAPNIEIGLRADGVVTWRMHAPDPISLVTTQAEAKK